MRRFDNDRCRVHGATRAALQVSLATLAFGPLAAWADQGQGAGDRLEREFTFRPRTIGVTAIFRH